MERKRRLLTRCAGERRLVAAPVDGPGTERVEAEMTCALALALGGRETTAHVVAHSRRVMELAGRIADRLEVGGSERDALRCAAQLHELGMVAVPAELLLRAGPLGPRELARVRAQAAVGAEIVRATHGQLAARLIEVQYRDYAELRGRWADSRQLLLAGVLRVADTFDAMRRPRPYQAPLPAGRCDEVLRAGSGSKFHPVAVYALLQLSRESLPG